MNMGTGRLFSTREALFARLCTVCHFCVYFYAAEDEIEGLVHSRSRCTEDRALLLAIAWFHLIV